VGSRISGGNLQLAHRLQSEAGKGPEPAEDPAVEGKGARAHHHRRVDHHRMQHHRQGGPEATANQPGHQNQAPPSTAAPWPPALRRKPPGQRRTSEGHRLHSRTPAARIRTTRKHCAGLIKANSAVSTILATQEKGAHENPCLPIQIRPHGLMSKKNRGQLRHQQSGAEASQGRADFLPPEEQSNSGCRLTPA
jgi:hypothetical protein